MKSIIDELERLIRNSVRVPVGGKLLVDESELRRIADELRTGFPNAQRESQRLTGESERILADAHAQARRIIEDAHGQAGVRLDDQAVVVAARQRARDVTTEAEKAATQLRADADQYITNQFNMMEARLVRVLREVQAGQRALTKAQGGEASEQPQATRDAPGR